MPDPIQDEIGLLDALLAEAEHLLSAHPHCHNMRNEMGALALIRKMSASGIPVALSMAQGCLERMRITVETGVYPKHLLKDPASAQPAPEGPPTTP